MSSMPGLLGCLRSACMLHLLLHEKASLSKEIASATDVLKKSMAQIKTACSGSGKKANPAGKAKPSAKGKAARRK